MHPHPHQAGVPFSQHSSRAYDVPGRCLQHSQETPATERAQRTEPSGRKMSWTNLCHLTAPDCDPEGLMNFPKVTERVSCSTGSRTQLFLASKDTLPLLLRYVYIPTCLLFSQGASRVSLLGPTIPSGEALSSPSYSLPRYSLSLPTGWLLVDPIIYSAPRF